MIEQNLDMLRLGICYDCAEDLRRNGAWLECSACGRSFQVDAGRVTERIPLGPEWKGSVDIAADTRLVLADGTVIDPKSDDYGCVTLDGTELALECDWRVR